MILSSLLNAYNVNYYYYYYVSHTSTGDSAVLAVLSVRPIGNYFSLNAFSNGNKNLFCLTGDFHFDSQMLLTHGYVQRYSGLVPAQFIVLILSDIGSDEKYLPTIVGGINNSLVFLLYFHALMPGIPGAGNTHRRLVNGRIVIDVIGAESPVSCTLN